MSQATEKKMMTAYTAAGGKNVGAFPWASIIQFVMSLFGGCATPKAVKRWARRNPEACMELIDDKLKTKEVFASPKDRKAAVVGFHKTFLTTPDEEIEAAR